MLTAKLESISKKKKLEKNEKRKEKFKWKKEGPKNVMDTKDRNGETYHWCTKHKRGHFTRQVYVNWKFLKETTPTTKKKEINYN